MELMRKGAEGGRAGLVSKKKGWGLEELRWAGGWGRDLEGAAPDATRMCGGSSDRTSTVGEKGAISKRQRKRFEKMRAVCG